MSLFHIRSGDDEMRRKQARRTKQRRKGRLLKAKIKLYYTVADGEQRIFYNRDAVSGYGAGRIPSPSETSFTNLFVNGVLQPQSLYRVNAGRLKLLSDDLPVKGTPIVAQFIQLWA